MKLEAGECFVAAVAKVMPEKTKTNSKEKHLKFMIFKIVRLFSWHSIRSHPSLDIPPKRGGGLGKITGDWPD
jgi:hypothetical protein